VNLIDAVKSGKPFRRKVDVKVYGEDFWCTESFERGLAIGREDVLAEDWEVKPDVKQDVSEPR
jgi:hypothetical protein